MDIRFVVMPFASIQRPALGVSLLKAATQNLGISSTIDYFNLKFAEKIGSTLYDEISEGSMSHWSLVGELIFAGYAFGRHFCNRQTLETLFHRLFALGYSHVVDTDLIDKVLNTSELVADYIEDCASEILRKQPRLVGFSTTFYQNCASVSLAKALKREADIPIIFGGANCEGEMGATLLKVIPWIDFVCCGEGDIAFIEFLKSFLNGNAKVKINGIITRDSKLLDAGFTSPVMDVDSLPFPDFDDYFVALTTSLIKDEFSPTQVIETSRGCWWGEKFQCKFCGLNKDTIKYRSKSVSRLLKELEYLLKRYGKKRFLVVDNILDLKYIDTLFPEIRHRRIDAEFFYETKSNISERQLAIMKRGGVDAIQPGIESLSDLILKMMDKGVSAFQNIQLLKWCRALQVIPHWNIIWGFPREPPEEYDKMAKIAPLLVHLHPPHFIKMSLDRFSPYFIDPGENGITNVRPMFGYKLAYPFPEEQLQTMAYHFDFDYCDGRDPSSYVKNLREEIDNWWKLWIDQNVPTLNMVRMGDVGVITDSRPCSAQRYRSLSTEEIKIYESCQSVLSFDAVFMRVEQDIPSITKNDVHDIICRFVQSKVMLNDNDKYLSLAIPVRL